MTVERPAYFDAAMKKLGLQHALGSLRLVKFDSPSPAASDENVDVGNLPTQDQQADKQSTASQEGQVDSQSPWVPLHLQLGLPLAPAELCDLVCRYRHSPLWQLDKKQPLCSALQRFVHCI